jgi:hypothetical protein
MKHRRSIGYKRLFKSLPPEIQELAEKQFKLLKSDPGHSSVSFKSLKGTGNYSARVNQDYRVLGTPIEGSDPTVIVWFFIGTHSDYNHAKTKSYKPVKKKIEK